MGKTTPCLLCCLCPFGPVLSLHLSRPLVCLLSSQRRPARGRRLHGGSGGRGARRCFVLIRHVVVAVSDLLPPRAVSDQPAGAHKTTCWGSDWRCVCPAGRAGRGWPWLRRVFCPGSRYLLAAPVLQSRSPEFSCFLPAGLVRIQLGLFLSAKFWGVLVGVSCVFGVHFCLLTAGE